MGVLTIVVLVAMVGVVGAQFNFMPPMFPHGNLMRGISDMVRNIGHMSANMAANGQRMPNGHFITTNDLAPGQQEVIRDGNFRGMRYRSDDGRSSGFTFHSGSQGGSGYMSRFGPNGQETRRFFF